MRLLICLISRNQKETPIEREIRLAREREEELRREKRLPPFNSLTSPAAGKQEVILCAGVIKLIENYGYSVLSYDAMAYPIYLHGMVFMHKDHLNSMTLNAQYVNKQDETCL